MANPRTFKGLMKGKRWESILEVLKLTGKKIYVAEAEAIMSQGGGVFISDEGFKDWSGIVGMAAAYSSQQPDIKTLKTSKEVLKAVQECDNGTPLPPENELVASILRQFKQIQEAM